MIEAAFDGIVKRNSTEGKLLAEIDPSRMPRHIAVIMDGNGRWAKMRGRPRIFGHREGAESVRSLLDTSARLGIEAITLFAFSTENWKRPKAEVSALMSMLKRVLKRELREVHGNNIRFRTIGDVAALSEDVREQLAAAEELTAGNTGTVMNVALNYGSRAEIVRAAALAAKKGEITEESIEANLYTSGLPPVDLLIRTSGEFRISNFLLWQIAYSEIYVTPTLFPDFRRRQLFEAIIDFQKRDRRYGGLSSSSPPKEK
ncbi:MAG: UDP pyrophosphate synthetase [Acidobacteria bacterium OLB17]|nr:MAG: UDP pyrophosphate synthetase [Acidobacteria bacterium OLB17]MCZ2390928.1 di-trans,poly-cis-decaprenylcistransferase [Acidobacteriota bacterium]